MVNDFNNYRTGERNKANITGHNLRNLSERLKELILNSDRRIIKYYK